MIKLDDKFTEQFSPNEQLVMLRLLVGADDDGMIEITTRTFAEICGLTRQQLRTILNGLSQKKEIEMVVSKKTNPKGNPKGNPKSTFVTICKYDIYRVGRRKTNQNPNQNVHQNKDVENLLTSKIIRRDAVSSEKKRLEYIEKIKILPEGYFKFIEWLTRFAPYCFSNMDLPTEDELEKLKGRYSGKDLSIVIRNIENRVDKRKLYKNLYLTTLNWAKKGYNLD